MSTSLRQIPRPAWAAIVVVLGAGLYTAAWFSAAAVLKGQAATWIAAQQRAGYVIDHSEPTVSGFPAQAIVTYADWRMAAPATSTAWAWRTPAIRVSAAPWAPLRFTVDLAGDHQVTGLGAAQSIISAAKALVRPALSTEGRISEIDVDIAGVTVSLPGHDTAVASIETAALAVTRERTSDGEVWHVTADAANWHAPLLEDPSAFTPNVRSLRFTADLTGALPSGTLPEALRAWHESGGTLEVRELLFDWPPLSISANGTLALDAALQPVGALTATFKGFNETLEAFARQNSITRSEADTAQAVLGLMARKPENGGAPELRISVTAQDSKLYLGPIALLTLEPVAWPESLRIP